MAAAPADQRELQLVDNVEFKILAVANVEDKLAELLGRYLAPVILKADSSHAAVRVKVIQLLSRLRTFIQPPSVVLPVKALLEQYKSSDSAIIKQLDLPFIQHSLSRLDEDDRRDLVPIALRGCSKDEGQARAATFFNIILQLLLDIRLPSRGSKDDEKLRVAIGLEDEADAKYLAKTLSLFLRLRPPTPSKTLAASNPTFSTEEANFFSVEGPGTDKIFQNISQLRAKIVTFLASAAFTDEEKFLPALYASSSPDTRVASLAEEIIKRTSVSFEQEDLVKKLFDAHARLPAAYRTRILTLLAKSAISTTMSQSIMNVVKLDFLPSFTQDSSTDALKPSSSLEKTKLHKALFQFLSWVAQVGPSNKDFSIGPNLIKSMQSYIESQGWPAPVQITHDEVQLRSRGYETIGMLARSADMPFKERIELAAWLFQSLSEDPTNDAVVNIDGALSSLTANIPQHIADEDTDLRNMLLKYMSLPEKLPAVRSTRHAVVKWANECLSFTNIDARWINFMAVAGRLNERSDVVEQGHKGLDPWTYSAHSEIAPVLPDWRLMVFKYFITAPELQPAADSESGHGIITLPDDKTFDNFRGSRIHAFPLVIQYCKQMMLLAALDNFNIQPDWMQALSAQMKTNIKSREKIRDYLRYVDASYIKLYLNACLVGAFVEDAPITEECLRSFVDVASLTPRVIVGEFTKHRVAHLLPLIKSNKSEIRHLSARALGILAAHPTMDVDETQNWGMTLNALFDKATTAVGPDLNAAEGALAAYGYLCSRSVFYNHAPVTDWKYPLHILVEENVAPSLFDAAVDAFTHLWLAKLAIPPKEGATSLDNVIKKLSEKAKKGNEKAIVALGMLAASIPDSELPESPASWSEGPVGTILKELFALHEIKRVEVQFTVGDAITIATARWDSDYVKLLVDVEWRSRDFQSKARNLLLANILDKLFEDCKATKPSLLKASGIWLFCIVQYCSDLPEVNSRLRQAQAAFMRLLSSRDELVQETASRGLNLVHERGDEQLKAILVKDLVSAFTGSSTQLKVDEDTELFEPGALPTGEGSSVSSYKDIVSLANEVGDQRLVYKFMALAINAATWTVRSAFGRFGLTNILSDAEVDPKIYPKLYRYRFDPNTNVQRSMNEIWKALVKDPKAVMDAHFDAIMEELLKSILGREWRMREASCAAISDLLTGIPFQRYERFYDEIWTKAVKVLDDVKGSVREAAFRLCRNLSNTLVRQLEEGTHESSANAMMQKALPFLLSDKAAESSVQEVQVFAIITIIKMAKHGGKHLKPFIPEMIPKLLGLLSTIEPQQINYYYQQVGEDSREKIDKLRSKMVNDSPISEAIDNILRFVDEEVMTELAPRLEATIKTAIGLPTKIGCSRVLTALFTRHTNEIKSVSTRFLELLGKQVLDKNDEVSQAYARAAAYIMRVVSDSAKQRFSERMLNLYLQSEEESRRQKVSDVIVSLAKVSPDHFTTQETILLPFAYLGSHDVDEYTSKVFREVWDQHSGSNRTVVRYVLEIVDLIERCLAATQWALRHTGAFTVAAMVSDVASASDTTGAIAEANLKAIWPVYEKALALKTFPGKEKLLESFPDFIEKGQSLWRYNSEIAAQMKKIVIREAKRNNDEYRVHAFRCLWRFAKSVDDFDIFQDIVDIVSPHLEHLKDEDKMDVDSKEVTVIKTAKNGLEAVARGYTRSSARRAYAVANQIIKALEPFFSSPKFNAIKREVWYEAVSDLMKDLASSEPPTDAASQDTDGVLQAYLSSLDVDKAEVGVESQRLKRAEAVSATLKAYAGGVFGKSSAQMDDFEAAVARAKEEERVPEVQKVWQRVLVELKEARH
ncbi:proteasome component ecm29 [Trichoderma arundinaceum]|uniref:Proteasome component ecm29 n=1 Tax=Trichoderma arundinaceum TaxID=490622 RepID=A0A395NMA8_TRIAR|nr:proteasome component ecm29 [Trichoderma arundinaceum]